MNGFLKILFEFLIFPGLIFLTVIGLLLTWLDRKITARLQWRQGPPWYQGFADILKLLIKETIVPKRRKFIFILAPVTSVISLVFVSLLLYYANFFPEKSFLGDTILLIYLLAIPPLASILGAASSKNPLSAVGASREMTLYFAYELPFIMITLLLITKTHGQVRLSELIAFQKTNGVFLYSLSGVLGFIVYLFAFQAKLGYVPFDIAEAEQELMAGVYTEYSGFGLAMFKISKAMMLFLLPCVIITLLWGGFNSFSGLWKFSIIFILILLIKNTNPRLRIDQAVRFFWFGLVPLSIISVILGIYNL
jgi:NADH-quinone oxidoreductase subunit H